MNSLSTRSQSAGARSSSSASRLCRLLPVALLFVASAATPLRAGPVVDQNAGYSLDAYTDNTGIASASQVQVAGGTVSLAPLQTAGHYITGPIIPTSFFGWDKLTIVGNYGALSDLMAEVLDQGGNPLVPPMPPQPVSAPISLASLNLLLGPVPAIRIKVYFNKSGLVAPSVDSLRVTWVPKSHLLLDKQGPATVQAGGSIVYGIRYSVSYVAAQNLVIYDTLASGAAGTLVYPTQYGQNDDLMFVTANKGGQYTAGGITVNGVPVPANSVYWNLGNVAEGITDLLSVTVATKNGTLDGTLATNCAYARVAGASAASATSCVVTVIHSAPAPLIRKQPGPGIFNINGV